MNPDEFLWHRVHHHRAHQRRRRLAVAILAAVAILVWAGLMALFTLAAVHG